MRVNIFALRSEMRDYFSCSTEKVTNSQAKKSMEGINKTSYPDSKNRMCKQ